MQIAAQSRRPARSRTRGGLPLRARRLVAESRRIGEEARFALGRAAAYLRWELDYSAKETASELGVPVREVARLIEEAEDRHWSRAAADARRRSAGKPDIPWETAKARLGLA